jgi:hypothetical protein
MPAANNLKEEEEERGYTVHEIERTLRKMI